MKNFMNLFLVALLASFTIPNLNAQDKIKDGVLQIAKGTTAVKGSAYQTNLDITDIQFPSSLKTIGPSAFRFCAYIETDLLLPDGLESIGANAFYNCVNVRRITIPPSVKSIGENAICRNTTMIVKKNSFAHKWAVENNRDYQFKPSGLPEGVTEVYTDYFVKTAWNQRGGKMQFSPERERVLCGNLADAAILYHYGIRYHGSHGYKLRGEYISADFDKDQADPDNIPRIFISSFSDERMYDADLYLWNHCVAVERGWGGGYVSSDYRKDELMMMFAPVKIIYYEGPFSKEERGYGITQGAMEEVLMENFANGRPVYTVGKSLYTDSDHAWILDGLRKKDGKLQVHCNFGWNGGCDGWYYLWEPIYNSMIEYDAVYSSFRAFTPLTGDELAKWKAPEIGMAEIICNDGHLYIPDGNTKIKRSILEDNHIDASEVKTIYIPSSVKTIEYIAFKSCNNITEVTIPENVEEIGEEVFAQVGTVYYNAIDASKTSAYAAKRRKGSPFQAYNNTAVKHFVIGKNVKVIPADLLKSNYSLKTITIPGNVERIGFSAFNGSTIEEAVLEEGVQIIEDNALSTSAMKTIVIPSSVNSIGKGAIHKNTIIICPVGSYADTWAKENGNKVVNR